MPIADGSIDMVVFMCVTHHLTDDMLNRFWTEANRVLKPAGRFILFDAVYDAARRVGLLLWKLDRGSNPRTPETLRVFFERHFKVGHWEEFAILHHYVFGIGHKKSLTPNSILATPAPPRLGSTA